MKALTPTQLRIVAFIADHIAAKGFSPSFREIGAVLGGTSVNNVWEHLCRIEVKGAIKRADYKRFAKSRTITLTDFGYEILDRRPPWVEAPPVVAVTPPSHCGACGSATFAPNLPCVICKLIAEAAA